MAAENVDGIFLLDKPRGITSNAALQAVKRLMGAKKAGHGGTLDPMATGLLPICFGEATKFAGLFLDAEKSYSAEMHLGVTTTTGDAEGAVVEQRTTEAKEISEDRLRAVLRSFVGGYDQLPPVYSALKHQGRPHYEYARAGLEVPRVSRRVTISALTLDGREGDCVRFSVTCGKGTYIRSLAEDIGRQLGCGAHLSGLRRVASGAFRISHALTLRELDVGPINWRRAQLLSSDAALVMLPKVTLTGEEAVRLQQGQGIAAPQGVATGLVRLYVIPSQFIGLGEVIEADQLIPRRLLAQRNATITPAAFTCTT
jgi:tRNA pseudouridine55 synthase